MALAEDARPQVHELGLVEASVLVLVEDLDQRDGSVLVVAHRLAYHRHHLVRAQHAVVVAIQLAEALRYLLVPVVVVTEFNTQSVVTTANRPVAAGMGRGRV